MVVLNKNAADTPLALDRFDQMLAGKTSGTDVISGRRYALNGRITLPARSVLVLEVQ
jgi:hypothetical protein